ncbi:hypothetical protein GGR90_002750 [Sphingopyxis italica]|uniref:Uncharacterized protein n=1 Tax=Sphingopyxis italica TaxID=1129133 RepID=A0A7X6B9Y5_9SPHN|nr:hypothetical protein [Sphingopyxis italica]NJB90556.1 hypothetical protein [Sphingopyxis italica]
MSAAVVKLPTAARRMVRQPMNKEGRASRAALREQQGIAFDYRFPTEREAEGIASAIHPMTPERWLLLAMLHVMPAEQFEKLTAFGVHGNPAIRGLLQMAKGGVGLNMDVMNALERCGQ